MSNNLLGLVGSCTIETALLVKYDAEDFTGKETDIKNLITAINISESTHATDMHISMRVYDTIGVLENYPLIGEERLYLTVREEITNVTIELDLFLTRVSNVTPHPSGNGVSYILDLMTSSTFKANCRKVVAPFKNLASEICKDIFDQNYNKLASAVSGNSTEDKLSRELMEVVGGGGSSKYEILSIEGEKSRSLTIEQSDIELQCVIPSLRSNEAMTFIANKAVNQTSSKSSSYKFFETKKGYIFATDELLIRQAIKKEDSKSVKKFTYNNSYDYKPEFVVDQAQKIKNIEILTYVDTMSDLYSGAYKSRFIELDVVYGRALTVEFDASDAKNLFGGMGTASSVNNGERHTPEFISTIFMPENAIEIFRVKDYDSINNAQLPGEQMIGEKYLRSNSYETRLNSTQLRCTVDGRLDLSVGDVVDLIIPEMTTNEKKEMSKKFAGKYLIRELTQQIEAKKLETSFIMVKYGWEFM